MSQIKVYTSAQAARRGARLKSNSMSSTGRFESIPRRERKKKTPMHFSGEKMNMFLTKGHRRPSLFRVCFFFFYHKPLFSGNWFVQKLESHASGPSGVIFHFRQFFKGGEMAWNWILWQLAVLLKPPRATQYSSAISERSPTLPLMWLSQKWCLLLVKLQLQICYKTEKS